MNSRIMQCPNCGSYLVYLRMRDGGIDVNRDSYTFINVTYKICSKCDHTWDRKAHRGLTVHSEPMPKPPGFFAHLFHLLFSRPNKEAK